MFLLSTTAIYLQYLYYHLRPLLPAEHLPGHQLPHVRPPLVQRLLLLVLLLLVLVLVPRQVAQLVPEDAQGCGGSVL